VSFIDFDDDGFVDAWIGNDGGHDFPDRLYVNDGTGRFTDQAPVMGLDYNFRRDSGCTMGIDIDDFDFDRSPDALLSTFVGQPSILYRCVPHPETGFDCDDVASMVGLTAHGTVDWAGGFVDFDNDRDQDVFMVSGNFLGLGRAETDTLYWNAAGTFARHTPAAGEALSVEATGRGAAYGDLDDDGAVDVIVANVGQRLQVLRNQTQGASHWLLVRLSGRQANRDGIGARVTVRGEGGRTVTQKRVAGGDGNYSGTGDPRLHFGLGTWTTVDVEVKWPGGKVQIAEDVAADQVVTIVEGE
jgi:hypothetical protein